MTGLLGGSFPWVLVSLAAVLALAVLGRPLMFLLQLGLRTTLGLGTLWAFAPLGGFVGVSLGVNLFNGLVLGLLGVPGFGLLLLLHWFLS